VVAGQLLQEPYVEILHCTRCDGKARRQFRNLRSTRHLDFKPNRGTHPDLVLTAHAIRNRYLIPREKLADFDPDSERCCDENAVERILWWYALRYSRPAWPDSFVTRVGPRRKDFERVLSDLGDEVEVRVALAPRNAELGDGEQYLVAVWFIVDAEIWAVNVPLRAAAQAAFLEFLSVLRSCQGIAIHEDSGVRSGDDFTWQKTRLSDEWNFANLSFAE